MQTFISFIFAGFKAGSLFYRTQNTYICAICLMYVPLLVVEVPRDMELLNGYPL